MMTNGETMKWEHGETWFRVIRKEGGKMSTDNPPVIVIHGGPGAAHNYVLGIARLAVASGKREAVVYDQIGCGKSTHYNAKGKDSSFWTPELFMDELECLIQFLEFEKGYVLIGHSWGGMLATQFAATRKPSGLKGLVVCDSPASMPVWISETNRLRSELPIDIQNVLKAHEDAGTTDSAEYEEAVGKFYEKHLCRIPMPQELLDSFSQMKEDPTVYHTMNGASEFFVTGTLHNWDIRDQLCKIDVPTLLCSGYYDEATPSMVSEIQEKIPGSVWELFEESSHVPHIEEPAKFMRVLGAFLDSI